MSSNSRTADDAELSAGPSSALDSGIQDLDSGADDTADGAPPAKRQKKGVSPRHTWKGLFWKNKLAWIPDGDIILICDDMGYRVHKETLATHSEVFDDLFSHATINADERYEDCDVVRLPDGSSEFYHLLHALYDDKYVEEECDVDSLVISGLLHLAQKYMFRIVRHDAVNWLKSRFPSTLKEYQAIQRTNTGFSQYKADCFWAVNIGEQYSVPVILPAAYYACALMPVEDIFDGASMRTGEVIRLSPSAQRTVMIFRQRLDFDKRNELNLRDYFKSASWKCPHARKSSGKKPNSKRSDSKQSNGKKPDGKESDGKESDGKESGDKESGDKESDGEGSDDEGSDDEGSDDEGSDDEGSDDEGSDDEGSDNEESDGEESSSEESDDGKSDSGECLEALWEAHHLGYQRSGCDIFVESMIQRRVGNKAQPCTKCASAIKAKEEGMRYFIWTKLPYYCGRNHWYKIQLQQAAADNGELIL